MSSTSSGREAEDKVAKYLKKQKFKILAQNWRRRTCEIDIVASKKNRIYFVEVKFRADNSHGGGLEYITASKLKQMQYVAELWVAENNWHNDYQLLAVEIDNNENINIVECT